MVPLGGVVVGDAVFIVLVLVSCLFIVGVGITAANAAAGWGRCRSCQRFAVRSADPAGQTLCTSCQSPRPRDPVDTDPTVIHDELVHNLLEGFRPRHHQRGPVESSP